MCHAVGISHSIAAYKWPSLQHIRVGIAKTCSYVKDVHTYAEDMKFRSDVQWTRCLPMQTGAGQSGEIQDELSAGHIAA